MRDIYMHGSLGKAFGRHMKLEVSTAAEAIYALSVNIPGFSDMIRKGHWRIVRGKSARKGMPLDEELIVSFNLGDASLHIVPAPAGAKNDGLMKVVAGVALLGLSMSGLGFLATPVSGAIMGATTWGNVAGMMGLSLALTGASTLLAPEQLVEESSESYLFSGPMNSTAQGSVIPIVYGEVITGGILVAGGLDIDRINADGDVIPSPTSQNALDDMYGSSVTVI